MKELKIDLENLTKETQQQILSLIQEDKRPRKRWRANIGENYYTIDSCGETYKNEEKGIFVNNDAYKFGNYYRTNEEAKFESEKQKVIQELKDYALRYNECEIDWDNNEQEKISIFYDYYNKCLDFSIVTYERDLNQIYFTNEKIVLDAIAEIGNHRIEKYLFGIE